jgi:hypothetical protein
MQGQGLPVDQDADRKDPCDDQDIPIATSNTVVDTNGDPPTDGKPPVYDGPPGGRGNHGSK